MSRPLISIHDLGIFFKVRGKSPFGSSFLPIVEHFSLELEKEETFCLIGESGSGKTTTAYALTGLHPFHQGRLCFDGKTIQRTNDHNHRILKSRTGIVFQDPKSSLNPYLSLRKSLEEPLSAKGVSKAKREGILKPLIRETGLTDELLDRRPTEVSGGENQRVCIARALSTRPDFLILDEPLTALDAIIRKQTIALLRGVMEKYRPACFLISHDMALVKALGHRVGVMYLGRLVETAPADVLFAAPAHPYTRALLSAVFISGIWKGRRIVLKGEMPSIYNPPGGCVFHTRCPEKTPRCSEEIPEISELELDHTVCCHLYHNAKKGMV